MVGRATLFDILGVEPEATDEEVERAWQGHFLNADADHERVPQEVRHAYQLLQDSGRRVWYTDMLRAAAIGHPVTVRPHEILAFQRMCELAFLKPYPDRDVKDAFLVRTHWQEPPRWDEAAQRFVPPPTVWERLRKAAVAVFFLQCFRGKSPEQKLALAILYLVVIFSGGWAVRWGATAFAENAKIRSNEKIHALQARTANELAELEGLERKLLADFERSVGIALEAPAGQRPRIVGDAILAHRSVSEAWAAIHNSRIDPSRLAACKDTLKRISQCVAASTCAATDGAQLDEIQSWIRDQEKELRSQYGNMNHIVEILDTQRTKQALDRSRGGTP